MNFKSAVLTVLVLALVGLGVLYYQTQRLLEESLRVHEESKEQDIISQKQKELDELRAKLEGTKKASEAIESPAPAPTEAAGAPGSESQRVRELEAQLEQQRKQTDAARQEAEVLARNEADKRDEKSKMTTQVENARVVGKVLSYDKESNLLIFHPVGQPSLTNNQELAVRRNNSIFVYLTVDEIDQESGTYSATVKMDELFKIGVEVEPPISEGEDIVIPPPMLQTDLPPIDGNSVKGSGTKAEKPAELEPIPWIE